MGKCGKNCPAVFLRGSNTKSEAVRKVLNFVLALIRYVGRVVNHDIKTIRTKWHVGIVSNNAGVASPPHIQADNWPSTILPKSPATDCGIQDSRRLDFRIEAKHTLNQKSIFTVPNGWKRTICSDLFYRRTTLLTETNVICPALLGYRFGGTVDIPNF